MQIIMARKGSMEYIYGYKHKFIKYWFTYFKFKLKRYSIRTLDNYDEI